MNTHVGRIALTLLASTGWSLSFLLFEGRSIYEPLALFGLGVSLLSLRLDPGPLLPLLRPNLRSLGAGVGAGLLLVGLTYLFTPLVAQVPIIRDELLAMIGRMRVMSSPTLAVCLTAWIIFVEEWIWRGVITLPHTFGKAELNPYLPLLLSSTLYALAQLGSGSVVLVAIALVFGLIWGLIRNLYGSLITPLVCHWIWDLCVLGLWPVDRLFPDVFRG